MRQKILMLLLVRSFLSTAQADPGTATANALVTLHIASLSESAWTQAAARISKEGNVNVEYSCITTGIVVLRLQHIAVSEKADVMAIVKRLLHEGGMKGHIAFLDVQVFTEDTQRCAREDPLEWTRGLRRSARSTALLGTGMRHGSNLA